MGENDKGAGGWLGTEQGLAPCTPSPRTPLGNMCDIPQAPLTALKEEQIVNLQRS